MKKRIGLSLLSVLAAAFFIVLPVRAAEPELSSPSVILMEEKTGTVIYEKNPDEVKSPASITKIMTLLLIFEALEEGRISLDEQVITSAYAKSMGGSQVFLEEGEEQSVETLIKCIAVASGNDASVAMAEHVEGSEAAFVEAMNQKAGELGMENTHFVDCSGLSNSDDHHTTARDVAIMSRELISRYPEIFTYTTIWMEDITHVTAKGESVFTLSSTNKLLKQYPYANGLKTGSTDKAGYCLSATAQKDDIQLIAVAMAAPDYKVRFQDCETLLTYGFGKVHLYEDEDGAAFVPLALEGGVEDSLPIEVKEPFTYLDTKGSDLSQIRKEERLPESVMAPVEAGEQVGEIVYFLGEEKIGSVPVTAAAKAREAGFSDTLKKAFSKWLFG